jgi:hypothetical protein
MTFARFQGIVQDNVDLEAGDVSVIAGDDERDTVSVRAWTGGCADFGLRLTADQAIKLGQLLIAAGEDTKTRQLAPTDAGTDEGEGSS